MNTFRTPQAPGHRSIQAPRTEDVRLGELRVILKAVEKRFRGREAVRFMPVALALGVVASIVLALVWRLRDELSLAGLAGAGLLLITASMLAAFLYAWLRPRDLMHTARLADHLLSLDERLATALEASTRLPENATVVQLELRAAQMEDALARARAISISRNLPLRLEGRRLIPAALLVALLGLVVAAPNPLSTIDTAAQGQIADEQKDIERIAEEVKASPRLAQDPALRALLDELSDLSRDLAAGDLKRAEAVARLSDTESKLQKALDAQARSQRAALDELAKQLAGSQSAPAKQIGAALQAGDTKAASDALQKAGAEAGKMSPQERQALADSLRDARDSLAALDPEMAQRLSDAAESLSGSDRQAAQKALEDLGKQVEQTGEKLATQQQISQALAQLQQSKQNIAQAGQGQPTSQPGSGTTIANGTAIANARATIAAQGGLTPQAGRGTPLAGTPVALGSPVQGQLPQQGTGTPSPAVGGTPVFVPGTPGAGGTTVAIPGEGQPGGQGGSEGNQPGQGNGLGQGGTNWGTGRQEAIYAPPSSLNATVTPVVVQGQPIPGGEQGSAPINGGTTTGEAQVPYEQVYGQYLEQAGNALGSDYIPQGYKDLVRDYFSELEPGR